MIHRTVRSPWLGIGAMEDLQLGGIHLEMYVDTAFGNDEEAFGHFEYTGRKTLYVIRRMRH